MTLSINDLIEQQPAEVCDADLTTPIFEFDGVATYGPGASKDDVMPDPVIRRGQLPVEYQKMSPEELDQRIVAAREKLGEDVVLLGHFYQRDEIVKYADFLGDSYQLANAALTRPKASTIVLCGVHFMAESADILSCD